MDIREYGALSKDGQDWTAAFAEAIRRLNAQGGGVLTVSPGEYPTGSIELCGDVTLDVQSGARIRFLPREDAYPLVELEFEGIAGRMYRPCLFARGAANVRVTGGGTLDGQGAYWWRKARAGTLAYPRPYLACFADCEHVTLENVTLVNSPVWTVHPLRCRDVRIRGLRIVNPADSPNTDGVDPNACADVRITDCTIDVGDDCIAIKSGTEDTPDRRPCERVIISHCHLLHGHGGVVLGSEMSGDVRDVLVSDCVFSGTDRGVRLKTRRGRGGQARGIRLHNLLMDGVMCPFVFNMFYFCGKGGKLARVGDPSPLPVDAGTPALCDVTITGVTAYGCSACAGYFYGLPEQPVERVTLTDVLVVMDENAAPGVPAMMEGCPAMRGAGFYMRNARDVTLSRVRVVGLRGATVDQDDSVTTRGDR